MARKLGLLKDGRELWGYDFKETEVKALDDYSLEIIGSTGTLDRDREVLSPDGWDLKNYKKNPIVLPAHNYSAPAIANANKVKVEEGKLRFIIKFPEEGIYPLADIYRKLYKSGFMKASSIGFIPLEWKDGAGEKEPRRTYLKQELLELSLVSVPANPEALVTEKGICEAISKGIISQDEMDMLKEAIAEGLKGDDNGNDDLQEPGNFESSQGKEKDNQKEEKIEEKPYANEHSCRLEDPSKYNKFARKKCAQKHDGKCIDVIYGIKGNKSEIQALRYKKDIWSKEAARKHCQSRDGTFEPAKETEQEAINLKDLIDKDWEEFKKKIYQAIKELQDKEFYKSILFGEGGDSSNPNLEKERIIDTVKDVLRSIKD